MNTVSGFFVPGAAAEPSKPDKNMMPHRFLYKSAGAAIGASVSENGPFGPVLTEI
jgi:hypothetical protein